MDLYRKKALKELDRMTSFLRESELYNQYPNIKWIKAIRTALGMTSEQLSRRMRLSRARVSAIENSEGETPMTTETLQKAAEALGCRFVYAFVPHEAFDQIMKTQAREKALKIGEAIHHTMVLEDQATDPEMRGEIVKDIERRLLSDPQKEGLWEE